MSVKVTNNMEKNSLQENTTHIKIKTSKNLGREYLS